MILLKNTVKFAQNNCIEPALNILEEIETFLIPFLQDKEIDEIIGNGEKTKLVCTGLAALTTPSEKSKKTWNLQFLTGVKKFFIEMKAPNPAKLAAGMNITLNENIEQPESHFINDLNL